MKVFLDTMVYLHYRCIDELDLTEILGQGCHTIIMPRVTLRELDKHKNTHSSNKIRERARKILKKMEQWAQGEEVRPGVGMELLCGFPDVDFHDLGLNRDWPDDILIAAVLQYNQNHPNEDGATLVTQDSAPRITASQLDIRVMELPDNYKLPVEPDPIEAENRELIQTITDIQNALPNLVVTFTGSEKTEQHANFVLRQPPDSMEDEIERKMEYFRDKLPKQHPHDPSSEALSTLDSRLQSQLASVSFLDPIPPEEYTRYNREIDEYLEQYERYMRDTWEQQAAMRRAIRFSLEIRNTGTAPAEDVDALFHFPDGFQLFSKDQLHEVPEEPSRPREPRTRMQKMTDRIAFIPHFNLGQPAEPDFKMPNSFSIERTQSYEVRDHFARIKHGNRVALPEMFLIFDSYESASSFACDFTIRPANLPSPIRGQLHFVIEKEDANEVIDEVE